MKRVEFRLSRNDGLALDAAVDAAGVSVAQFVRQAIAEKIDRDRLMSGVRTVLGELTELLVDIRQENTRARRDLGEDATKHLELQRREAAASLRKNEELNKTLVMELARSLGSGGKPSAPASRGDWSNLD